MSPLFLDTGTSPRINAPVANLWWNPILEIRSLDVDLDKLSLFDAIILSSKQSISVLGADFLSKFAKIYVVGPQTAKHLIQMGINPDLVGQGTASELLTQIAKQGCRNSIVHPCSAQTRLRLDEAAALGLKVENIPVYSPDLCPDFEKTCLDRTPDLVRLKGIFYFSGSAVRAMLKCSQLLDLIWPIPHFACGESASEALKLGGFPQVNYFGPKGPPVDWFLGEERS